MLYSLCLLSFRTLFSNSIRRRFSKFIDFVPFLWHGKVSKIAFITLQYDPYGDRVLFPFMTWRLWYYRSINFLLAWHKCRIILKMTKVVWWGSFVSFYKTSKVKNTNTTQTWQLLLLFRNKSHIYSNNNLKA